MALNKTIDESNSAKNSPRNPLAKNGSQEFSNPFVDKSDIARHKQKISQLVKRNEQNLSLYDNIKYSVSPKDEKKNSIVQDVPFATILDQKSKLNFQNMKDNHISTIDINHNMY